MDAGTSKVVKRQRTPGTRLGIWLSIAEVVLLAPTFYFFSMGDDRNGARFLAAGFGAMLFINSRTATRRIERILGGLILAGAIVTAVIGSSYVNIVFFASALCFIIWEMYYVLLRQKPIAGKKS